MKRFIVALVLTVSIGCIPIPTPPPEPPVPPPCEATLAFDVRESQTMQPLEGVLVTLLGAGEGTTNADGYIAWELPCGSYAASFTKQGYTSQTMTVSLSGNTQQLISLIRDIPPLQRLHNCGIHLCREDGTRWNWYGLSAFSLAYDISQGREADVVRFLDWAATNNVTIVRVLTTAVNLFDLSPEVGRNATETVLQLAQARGVYAELVGLADTNKRAYDHRTHIRELGALCARYASCLIEVANEPNHPTQLSIVKSPQYLRSLRELIPAQVLVAYGAAHGPSDESQDYTGGDYVTVHGDRTGGDDGWRFVRHTREMQAWRDRAHHKFTVNDEPKRNDTSIDKNLALGLLTRLYSIGDTFHYEGGLRGQIPTGDELQAFLARRRAWNALPQDWEGRYSRATLAGDPISKLDTTQILRAYSAINGNTAWVLGLKVESEASIQWRSGWNADKHISEGKTRLWFVQKPAPTDILLFFPQ